MKIEEGEISMIVKGTSEEFKELWLSLDLTESHGGNVRLGGQLLDKFKEAAGIEVD